MRWDWIMTRIDLVWHHCCQVFLAVLICALAQALSLSMAQAADPAQFLRKWGSEGDAQYLGQFNYPYAITVDADSTSYVADTGNHRIQVFKANGDFDSTWGEWGSG